MARNGWNSRKFSDVFIAAPSFYKLYIAYRMRHNTVHVSSTDIDGVSYKLILQSAQKKKVIYNTHSKLFN